MKFHLLIFLGIFVLICSFRDQDDEKPENDKEKNAEDKEEKENENVDQDFQYMNKDDQREEDAQVNLPLLSPSTFISYLSFLSFLLPSVFSSISLCLRRNRLLEMQRKNNFKNLIKTKR